mgnify:FL=1
MQIVPRGCNIKPWTKKCKPSRLDSFNALLSFNGRPFCDGRVRHGRDDDCLEMGNPGLDRHHQSSPPHNVIYDDVSEADLRARIINYC